MLHPIPFGLKNVEATYQRVMDRAFKEQIRRNMEVYVDDIIIKNKEEGDLIKMLAKSSRNCGNTVFSSSRTNVWPEYNMGSFSNLWNLKEV